MKETNNNRELFADPLVERYASSEMLGCFGNERRYQCWRRLWLELARAQKQLGLPIGENQLQAIEQAMEKSIDFAEVATLEAQTQHDVVAHLHAFANQCPEARGILHLGATSAFITDNADLLLIRDGLQLLIKRLQKLCNKLGAFCEQHKELRTTGYTHFQVAQPTTVGKRAALWLQDFVSDGWELVHRLKKLQLRGAKGTTGTQASFLKLFDGDHHKVMQLEQQLCSAFGFKQAFALTGQVYPRKSDSQILASLAGVAESASKFGYDLRLLQHLKEIEEPFGEKQVGSSAMPHKRNPILSERICSLSRLLIGLHTGVANTAATQWLERSLDDSAIRRLSIPRAFLLTDAILVLAEKIVAGLQVHTSVIAAHLEEQKPFLLAEMLLAEAVKAGGDRQQLHETMRQHSMAAFEQVVHGKGNDLLERLKQEDALAPQLQQLQQQNWEERFFVGRAAQQVSDYVTGPLQEFLSYEPTTTDTT